MIYFCNIQGHYLRQAIRASYIISAKQAPANYKRATGKNKWSIPQNMIDVSQIMKPVISEWYYIVSETLWIKYMFILTSMFLMSLSV